MCKHLMTLTIGDHWQVTGASFTDTNMWKQEVTPRHKMDGDVKHISVFT